MARRRRARAPVPRVRLSAAKDKSSIAKVGAGEANRIEAMSPETGKPERLKGRLSRTFTVNKLDHDRFLTDCST